MNVPQRTLVGWSTVVWPSILYTHLWVVIQQLWWRGSSKSRRSWWGQILNKQKNKPVLWNTSQRYTLYFRTEISVKQNCTKVTRPLIPDSHSSLKLFVSYMAWYWLQGCAQRWMDRFLKDFYFLEREGEKHWCVSENPPLPLTNPQPGTRSATQACALTGNWTGNLLVHSPVLNPVSHTIQGRFWGQLFLILLYIFLKWEYY